MSYIMPYSTIFKHKKYLDLSSYSAISYVTLVLSCLSIFYTIPPSSALAWQIPWTEGGAWWAAVHGFARSRTRLSDFTLTFHFHALEKEMATHSSVLA